MHSEKKDYFITIAEVGNITKAAEILYVSQPSLSQYITKLEKKMGIKLIERNYTPLRLTEAGEIYLDYAKKRQELERQLDRRLTSLIYNKDKLTIGIPLQITNRIFSLMIGNFIQGNVEYQISIKGGTSLTLLENFARYDLDVAFIHIRKMDTPGIIFKPLSTEKLCIVCNTENVLVQKRKSDKDNPIQISEEEVNLFQKQKFVMLSKEYMLYRVCEEYFDDLGIFPENTIELSNLDAILNYIIESGNDVVAMVPEFSLENVKNRENKLAFLKIRDINFEWFFTICRSSERELSDSGKKFWDQASNIKWI